VTVTFNDPSQDAAADDYHQAHPGSPPAAPHYIRPCRLAELSTRSCRNEGVPFSYVYALF
jgi:hypothetical protein